MKASVILPCYNEGENLKNVFSNWVVHAKKNNLEIIFVNNGSTDNSSQIFNSLNVKYKNLSPYFKIVNLNNNLGYGGGIQEGFKYASGEIFAWSHSDGQISITDSIKAIEKFRQYSNNNNFLLKGSRTKRKKIDEFFTKLMSYFVKIFTGYLINDINAQPKIFYKKYYNFEPLATNFLFDLDFLIFMLRREAILLEEKIEIFNRDYGKAKGGGSLLGKTKLIFATLKYLLNFK